MVQAHIFYSGSVQGVGFRYTVQRYAKNIGLSGWVRNLNDGRVEIVVEGKKGDIEELINRTEEHFSGYVRGKDVKLGDSQNKFSDFSITF